MRFLFKWLLVAVVLVALAGGAGVLFLDRAVQHGIENVGSRVAGVAVQLKEVRLSLLSGKGALRGLRVANPRGYRAPQAVTVGEIYVALRPLSVFSDRVQVRTVVVQAPEIHYEKHGDKTNLEALQANVEASLAADRDKAGRKLQIDSLIVRDAKVYFYDKPDAPPKTYTLKEIHLRDLGRGPEGVTGAELTARVTDVIVRDVATAVAKSVGTGIAIGVVKGLLGLPF